MDRLLFMKAFCRIVDLQSFSKASEDLGLSAATLSKEMRRLEDSLGCLLLNRSTRRMALTDHGQLYYDEARRLLGEIDTLEDSLRKAGKTPKGRLRINAPLSFGLVVLAPLIPQFRQHYPDVTLEITLDDRVLDIIEGGFDLSLRIRPSLPDSTLIARQIGHVTQHLCAAPGYFDHDRPRPQTPKDLEPHQMLSFSLSDHGQNLIFTHQEQQEPIVLQPTLTVNNSLFLKALLLAGQGIGALPSFIAKPLLEDGQLEALLPDYHLPERFIFAVFAKRLNADEKTRAFLAFLENALR